MLEPVSSIEYAKPLAAHATPIPGLTVFDLTVHGDHRGWFKENWQRHKMMGMGLPDFGPVQNNIAFNTARGTTRGIHAEPWDKYVSVATGSVFGAWVDLRQGSTFGTVVTAVIAPATAVFVPRGVGNAFQSLEDNTAYTSLINDHWSAEAEQQYTYLHVADETVAIDWPIPLDRVELSAKDRAHPRLQDVTPMPPATTLVLGASGQLGRELARQLADRPWVEFLGRDRFDLADPDAIASIDWRQVSTVVNAAAYTAVEDAETSDGGQAAWAVNAEGVARLASACAQHDVTLIHVSSDDVFDGTKPAPYTEADALSPVTSYGTSKAAGDLAVGVVPRHYLVRTSRVIGDRPNLVRTWLSRAAQSLPATASADQVGRLTFAEDLAAAIIHLRNSGAPYGTYNVTSTGSPASWADIARRVYRHAGRPASDVTAAAAAGVGPGEAFHERNAVLDLAKLESTGFTPRDQWVALDAYLEVATQRSV